MPNYIVQQGECLSSIAKRQGLFWEKIWNHPRNADLKARRKDPNILYPGDALYVPEREDKEERGATEQRHRFRVKGTPAKFRLRLLKEGRPRKGLPYTLTIDGKIISGETDDEGWIECNIPPDAQSGRLILDHGSEQYSLQLGHLDPVEETTGIQQRLRNLGFYSGEINGRMGPETQASLAKFQRSQGLEATGRIDEQTRGRLKDTHHS